MTALPQLERDLADAAARHYAPGWRRRHAARSVLRLRGPVAVGVAAAALVLALLVAGLRLEAGEPAPRALDQAAPAPTAGLDQLRASLAVFRRERRPADSLPDLEPGSAGQRFLGARLLRDESRLLASNGRYRYYGVPARGPSGDAFCVLTYDARRPGASGGCGPLQRPWSPERPDWSTTTRARQHQEYFALFPDSIVRVELELRNGRRLTRAVRENAVLVTVKPGIKAARWVDRQGRRYGQTFHDDPLDASD